MTNDMPESPSPAPTPTRRIPRVIGTVLIGAVIGFAGVYGLGGLRRPRDTAPEVSVEPMLFSSSGPCPTPSAHAAVSRCSSETLTGSPPHTRRASDRTESGELSTKADTRLGTAVICATDSRFISAARASASRCSASSARIMVAPAAKPASNSMPPSRNVIEACDRRMSSAFGG